MGVFRDIPQLLTIGAGKSTQRNSGDTGYEAKYIDSDFYKYQIVPSIDGSGNLTIALKNYNGDDPSTGAPVKIQIGDTIRTVTSALSIGMSAGTNFFNAGSSELATKEIDYFTYLIWKESDSTVRLGVSRLPYGQTIGDFTISATNEKHLEHGDIFPNSYKLVNGGRFSAILSAGAGYTWSEPASGFQVINYLIFETKWLDYNTVIYGTGGSAGTFATSRKVSKYRLVRDTLYIRVNYKISDVGSWTGTMNYTLPFTQNGVIQEAVIAGYCCATGGSVTKGQPAINDNNGYFLSGIDTGTLTFGTVVANDVVNTQGFCQI